MTNEQTKQILKQIESGFISFLKTDYKILLKSIPNLNKYSITNQLYILMQCPTATICKGFTQWKNEKISIKKGEKAISILAPIVKEQLNEETKELEKKVVSFKKTYVFDISQTNSKIEKIDFSYSEFNFIEFSKFNEIFKKIETYAKNKYQYSIKFTNDFDKTCEGLCDHQQKIILIRNEINSIKTLSILFHETAHLMLHSPINEFGRKREEIRAEFREVEAESVACAMCQYFNIDTSKYSFNYISLWSDGDIKIFRKSYNYIVECTNKLIEIIGL